MTSLTAEAVSFFSRGVRVKGQPGPKDVSCGVLVGLCGVSACSADKFGLGEPIFSSCMPACFAAVGGVPGVDFDPDASSVFRFGAQNRDEVAPARVRNTSVEPALGRCPIGQEAIRVLWVRDGSGPTQHIGDRQIFHRDQVVQGNKLSCGFVVEVAASVGNLAVSRGQCLASANTVVGPALGTAKPLLGGCQLFGRVASPARILNVYTIGGSGEGVDPHIYAGTPSSRGQRISGNLVTGEDQHPPAALSADLDRLHMPEHLAVRSNLDLPDAPQIYAVGVRMPTGTVTIFRPLDGGKPALALEPWVPRLSTTFRPSEKSREGSIKPSQRGLLARKRPQRHIRTQAPDLTQLGRLVPIPNPGLTMRPGFATLLQRSVVNLAMNFHTGCQRQMLPRGGTQPKLVSAPHTTTSHRYLKNDFHRSSSRTAGNDWDVGITPPEQLRNSGSAMREPYEAPLTNSAMGALWMYV